jgi:replicative superfamily II helicase
MLGGFLRALIRLGQKKEEAGDHAPNLLRRIRDLDLLFLAVASFEAREQLVPKSAKHALGEVSAYIEGLDSEDKPMVNLWRSADSADYPTRRLLSSLRFPACSTPAETEAVFNRLMATAVLLHRHARGETLNDLAREYGMHSGSLESGLKYTATWVLGCLSQICTSDRCYKLDFLALRIYELLEDLTMGSTLGKLLTLKGVGRATVEKLLNAGFSDIERLHTVQLSTLTDLGVADDPAGAILRFLRRSRR